MSILCGGSWLVLDPSLTSLCLSVCVLPLLVTKGHEPSGCVTQVYMNKVINSRMHFGTVVINITNLLEPSGKALYIILQYSPEQILSVP